MPAGDLHTVLDLAKVADSLLFILDATDGWDSGGEHCLSCLFAQGLPSYGERETSGTSSGVQIKGCLMGIHCCSNHNLHVLVGGQRSLLGVRVTVGQVDVVLVLPCATAVVGQRGR